MRRRYGQPIAINRAHDEELWKVDPENCCSAVKVGQLDRALASKAAWMSGLRRAEAASRSQAPIVARDLRGLVKVNPIATWSDLDVQGYIADHDVPVNPLLERGYTSIGCQPCTTLPTDPMTALGLLGGCTRRSAASTPGRGAARRPRWDGGRSAVAARSHQAVTARAAVSSACSTEPPSSPAAEAAPTGPARRGAGGRQVVVV